MPRSVRRAYELNARKVLTGSRKKVTDQAIKQQVMQRAKRQLRIVTLKKLGAKAAKILAPSAIPLGQFVTVLLSLQDAGTFCWCAYKCTTGRFQ